MCPMFHPREWRVRLDKVKNQSGCERIWGVPDSQWIGLNKQSPSRTFSSKKTDGLVQFGSQVGGRSNNSPRI